MRPGAASRGKGGPPLPTTAAGRAGGRGGSRQDGCFGSFGPFCAGTGTTIHAPSPSPTLRPRGGGGAVTPRRVVAAIAALATLYALYALGAGLGAGRGGREASQSVEGVTEWHVSPAPPRTALPLFTADTLDADEVGDDEFLGTDSALGALLLGPPAPPGTHIPLTSNAGWAQALEWEGVPENERPPWAVPPRTPPRRSCAGGACPTTYGVSTGPDGGGACPVPYPRLSVEDVARGAVPYLLGGRRPNVAESPCASCDALGPWPSFCAYNGGSPACPSAVRRALRRWLVVRALQGSPAARAVLTTTPCDLFGAVQGRTLWFAGDVSAEQHAKAAACLVQEFWDPAEVRVQRLGVGGQGPLEQDGGGGCPSLPPPNTLRPPARLFRRGTHRGATRTTAR